MKEMRKHFALCLDNTDYEVSIIPGKVYRVIPDRKAEEDDFIRIIDESGEDYLYHNSHFTFVDFPKSVEKKLIALETSVYQEHRMHA